MSENSTILKIVPFDAGISSIKITTGEAKGDLIGFSAPNAPIRVPVGADGQVLTANSSTPSGLKWSDISTGGSGSTGGVGYAISLLLGG